MSYRIEDLACLFQVLNTAYHRQVSGFIFRDGYSSRHFWRKRKFTL